ncbi:Uu.00g019570.m01.CDS01 [Anthostomella pinea]|uniref:Uu.00g019570.m01.CDS01 n=1 Tax=Anthostomella pinea TaxID=933095 RepID=A0AAI8VZB8_9PEZI|nr:Uu.00g019570.m01.CDS01 [Anthostomella pinea]
MASTHQGHQSVKVVKLASTSFLPFPGTSTQPNWNIIFNSNVTGLWLIYLKDPTSSPSAHGWVIGLVTASGQALHVYPKQTSCTATMAIVCQPACAESDFTAAKSFAQMAGSHRHFGRAMLQGVKIGHIFLGLNEVLDLCGHCPRRLLQEVKRRDTFGDCVIKETRGCLLNPNGQGMSLEITKGQARVHMWSKNGIKALKECNARMEWFRLVDAQ